MKIAVVMEPFAGADPQTSNTMLLIREACRRGHAVLCVTPEALTLGGARVVAQAQPVMVDRAGRMEAGAAEPLDLSGCDVVLMRQNPPVDTGYLTVTYLLEHLQSQGVLVSNAPEALRNTPEKMAIFRYPECIPPTLVSRDPEAITAFLRSHGEVVVKPLYGYYGHGIIRTDSMAEIHDKLALAAPEPLMFQPMLREVFEGNKRIVLFDGEMIGALRTVPQGDDFRIYRESRDEAYTPTPPERELCVRIGRDLASQGLHFIGIDLIGDYLTEINVTCVGSLVRLNAVYGMQAERRFWDMLERKSEARLKS